MYRHNIGERVTIISIYVFFGGTNVSILITNLSQTQLTKQLVGQYWLPPLWHQLRLCRRHIRVARHR